MKINQSRRRPQRKSHSPNQTQDSQGPDGKIRGTASQIFDKYLALARDATSSGDRISAESFYQYADHYYRLMNPDNENTSARHDASRSTNLSGSQPHGSSSSSSLFDDLPNSPDSGFYEAPRELLRTQKNEREPRFDTRKSRHPYVAGSNRHHHNERAQGRGERSESKSPSPVESSEPKKASDEKSTDEVITVIQ